MLVCKSLQSRGDSSRKLSPFFVETASHHNGAIVLYFSSHHKGATRQLKSATSHRKGATVIYFETASDNKNATHIKRVPDHIKRVPPTSQGCQITSQGCQIASQGCQITSQECQITSQRCQITSHECHRHTLFFGALFVVMAKMSVK